MPPKEPPPRRHAHLFSNGLLLESSLKLRSSHFIFRELRWVEVWIIQLVLSLNIDPIQLAVVDWFYWVENKHNPNNPSNVIVKACHIARSEVVFNREVQIGQTNDLSEDVLQHRQEKVTHIAIVLFDDSVPVLVHLLPGAVAEPDVLSEVFHQEERPVNLESDINRVISEVALDPWDLVVGEVRYAVEAVGRVLPIEVGSEASNVSVTNVNSELHLLFRSQLDCLLFLVTVLDSRGVPRQAGAALQFLNLSHLLLAGLDGCSLGCC